MFWPPCSVPMESASCWATALTLSAISLTSSMRSAGVVSDDDDVDLVAVVELAVVGRARREDDDRLAEERRALLAERRVVVEVDVVAAP